jgi:arsenite methyltransferase
MENTDAKKIVRDRYGKIAAEGTSCCSPTSTCCNSRNMAQAISRGIGYSDDELESVPEGANLGLGCGNPVAVAPLKEGDIVLDLGSGAGFDCFLAADKVGKTGKVIGFDMTPEMVSRARENARRGEYTNVEFRLGEIENLPVADSSVDIVISNCVISLSPDKQRAFAEAFRVLKPGGRIMVSDIVLLKRLPNAVLNSIEAYVSCVSGAMLKDEYLGVIEAAGFQDVTLVDEAAFPLHCMANDPIAQRIIEGLAIPPEEMKEIGNSILSAKVSAAKPKKSV